MRYTGCIPKGSKELQIHLINKLFQIRSQGIQEELIG